MKNPNIWVICVGLAAALILALAVPIGEPADVVGARLTGADPGPIGSCAPVVPVVPVDMRYAPADFRLDFESRGSESRSKMYSF